MLNLFQPLVSTDKLHPVFLHLCDPQFEPERSVVRKYVIVLPK